MSRYKRPDCRYEGLTGSLALARQQVLSIWKAASCSPDAQAKAREIYHDLLVLQELLKETGGPK